MARKMGSDGPKLQIREKNGHYYAYTSTSRMVDGKKKTINECVGRYDPDTGNVIPKKAMKSREEYARIRAERSPVFDLSRIRSRSYGASYLLDSIQKRIRLGEDLHRSFGTSSKAIMTCAMALTINPGPFSSISFTFENTYLRDLYGTEVTVEPREMSRFANNIGRSDMCADQFFECRVRRCNGLVAWDTTTNGTYSDIGGMAEWAPDKDGEHLKVVKRAMATDMRGIPLMYRFYPGSLSDIRTVERMEEDIRRYGREDAIFVMDRGFVSGSNLHDMLSGGRSFVIPAKTDSSAVKTLLTEFNRTRERKDMVHDGHAYTVWETEIGLKESPRITVDGRVAYDMTVYSDDGHASAGRMRAFVCYDSKKYSDEVQGRILLVDSLMEYARTMDEADPIKAFKKRAGRAAKYFDIRAEGRKVILTEKRNARTFNDNRAGMFVMLCSENIGWDLMMAAYDARRLTEQAFDTEKERDRRIRTGDPDTMEGRYLIQFVSQILLAEIRAVLREKDSDSKYSLEGILAILSTLDVLEYEGRRGLSEVTKNVRTVLKLFDAEVPKEPLYRTEMFNPSVLLGPVTRGESLIDSP